ncbi:uncharacterized protein [Ptychodera flava]|uniref:uncharacterized protein n=1 Tax=Ptychodera flava TaxID=63121 RepID=UPI00396A842A
MQQTLEEKAEVLTRKLEQIKGLKFTVTENLQRSHKKYESEVKKINEHIGNAEKAVDRERTNLLHEMKCQFDKIKDDYKKQLDELKQREDKIKLTLQALADGQVTEKIDKSILEVEIFFDSSLEKSLPAEVPDFECKQVSFRGFLGRVCEAQSTSDRSSTTSQKEDHECRRTESETVLYKRKKTRKTRRPRKLKQQYDKTHVTGKWEDKSIQDSVDICQFVDEDLPRKRSSSDTLDSGICDFGPPDKHETLKVLPQNIDKIINGFHNFAETCDTGELYLDGDFVGSVFDDKGGYLKLLGGDIVLYIPPDAIEKGQQQPVYCYVNQTCGQINTGEVLLTPVVSCGPDGVTFQKDVVLSLSHYAVNTKSWNISAIAKPTDGSWYNLPTSSDFMLLKEESVFFFVRHFTDFAAEGEASEEEHPQQRIKVGVKGHFVGDNHCHIDVGAWQDNKISSRTQKTGKTKWSVCKPIVVNDEATHLSIGLNEIQKGWKQWGHRKQKVISLCDVCADIDNDVANCQFILEYIGSSKDQDAAVAPQQSVVCCSLSLALDTSEREEDDVTFIIEKKLEKDLISESIPDFVHISNAEKYLYWNRAWKPTDSQITQRTWRKLCEVLDVDRGGRSDWMEFGGELNLTPVQLHTIGMRESPTSHLLSFFFTGMVAHIPLLDSLKWLEEIFTTMKNSVALEIIKEEIKMHTFQDNSVERESTGSFIVGNESQKFREMSPPSLTKQPRKSDIQPAENESQAPLPTCKISHSDEMSGNQSNQLNASPQENNIGDGIKPEETTNSKGKGKRMNFSARQMTSNSVASHNIGQHVLNSVDVHHDTSQTDQGQTKNIRAMDTKWKCQWITCNGKMSVNNNFPPTETFQDVSKTETIGNKSEYTNSNSLNKLEKQGLAHINGIKVQQERVSLSTKVTWV